MLLNILLILSININLLVVDTRLCTDATSLFWRFSWQYFKDQREICVISDVDIFSNINEDIMKCGMQNSAIPVSFKTRGWDITQIVRKVNGKNNLIYKPRIGVGLVMISESKTSLKIKLEKVAKLDHMAKIIIILINGSLKDSEDILKSSWYDHNMLNIVAIHNISIETIGNNFEMSAYDPFIIRNGSKGLVKTFLVRHDKILTGVVEELQNRLRDVRGYPLRICMFSYPGIAAPVKNKKGKITRFTLFEGKLIDAMMKAVNFNASYSMPRDGKYHGLVFPNGTMYGAIRDIEDNVSDIAANTRPVLGYGQLTTEFLIEGCFIELGFLTPKMNSTSLVSFFGIFSVQLSAAITGAFVIIVISWLCLQKISQTLTNAKMKEVSLIRIVLAFFGDMLLISQSSHVIPWFERYLFLGWTLFSMIICYSYQATMVEHLVASDLPGDINTMQELADSDLKVVTFKELVAFVDDVAGLNNAPEIYKRLAAKMEIVPGRPEAIQRVAYDRDSALLFTRLLCKVYQGQLITGNPRRVLTHVMKEAPPSRFGAQMIRRDSPFKDRLNQVILWIWQAGLIDKWVEDVFHEIERKIFKILGLSHIEQDVYTMNELSFIFLAWLGCCAVCCVVFVCEIFAANLNKGARYFGRSQFLNI